MLNSLLQGIFIGIAMVLPGLSAGTVILILGFYRQFLSDLSVLKLRPYLPIIIGAAIGVLGAVQAVSYLLERYEAGVYAFILGMLLASVPAVINCKRGDPLKLQLFFFAIAGFLFTWYIVCEPGSAFTILPPGSLFHFFIGGAFSSAAMLLPGVSGSSVLIIMNLYDDVIKAVSEWQWLPLLFLSIGFAVGILGLARLLSALYRRYQQEVAFLLAGLILGSSRALLPFQVNLTFFILAIAGAIFVTLLTRRRCSNGLS